MAKKDALSYCRYIAVDSKRTIRVRAAEVRQRDRNIHTPPPPPPLCLLPRLRRRYRPSAINRAITPTPTPLGGEKCSVRGRTYGSNGYVGRTKTRQLTTVHPLAAASACRVVPRLAPRPRSRRMPPAGGMLAACWSAFSGRSR